MRQLPTRWVKLAESRGIAGSANALALKAGIATTTLTRLVFGQSTSPDTIRKVSVALGVSQEQIRELAGIPTPLGVWVPPEQANELDQLTRDALDALILAIAKRSADEYQKIPGGTEAAMLEPGVGVSRPIPLGRETDSGPDPQSASPHLDQGSHP